MSEFLIYLVELNALSLVINKIFEKVNKKKEALLIETFAKIMLFLRNIPVNNTDFKRFYPYPE